MRSVPIRKAISATNLLYRGVPRHYIKATLSDYDVDKDIHNLFYNYLMNLELMYRDNVCLILYGANGNGKTWLSSLIIEEAYIYRFASFRVTLQNFIDMQFRKDEEEIRSKLRKIADCDFLVIYEVS